jgi:hypothetical protein
MIPHSLISLVSMGHFPFCPQPRIRLTYSASHQEAYVRASDTSADDDLNPTISHFDKLGDHYNVSQGIATTTACENAGESEGDEDLKLVDHSRRVDFIKRSVKGARLSLSKCKKLGAQVLINHYTS